MCYQHYTLNDPAASLPLSIFEAQPCTGKRYISVSIEMEEDSRVNLLITGNTLLG